MIYRGICIGGPNDGEFYSQYSSIDYVPRDAASYYTFVKTPTIQPNVISGIWVYIDPPINKENLGAPRTSA